jgi:hypothetical protein
VYYQILSEVVELSEQDAYLGKKHEQELLIGQNSRVAFADIMFAESAAQPYLDRMFTAVVEQHSTSSCNNFSIQKLEFYATQ